MSAEEERRYLLRTQAWGDAVSEHSTQTIEQRVELLRQGYMLFFDTVRELPGVDEQPKYWSDYREEEIDFVTHRPRLDSANERAFRMRIANALGFESYLPLRIGVFNVQEDETEANKGIHRHSANVVVESINGDIFRRRVVLHLDYGFSLMAQDWHEKGINYSLFGIEGDQFATIQRVGEMELLLAANAAAALFAEELRQEQKAPLTPFP